MARIVWTSETGEAFFDVADFPTIKAAKAAFPAFVRDATKGMDAATAATLRRGKFTVERS